MNSIGKGLDEFYLHIAKLFYAVAYIDGEIRSEEVQELDDSLHHEWIQKYQGKEKVVDEILAQFSHLHKVRPDADESFYEFLQYLKENPTLFTAPLRSTLWEVSSAIAHKVHKKNKSELILLVHLGKALGIMS